ncbi:MAG: glutamine amidotransferase-related protein, partial [Crocinitomicaceae bacterium]
KVFRIPHMGWNNLSYVKNGNNPLKNIENNEVYFVHSYFAQVKDKNIILSKTKYGEYEFCSAIQYRNVFGTQFHPEKSGKIGLDIYKNWAKINNLL